MTVMVTGVWVRVLCIFCVIVVPEVRSHRCTSYTDSQDKYHDLKLCEKYCCGKCSNKYCCRNKNEHFTEEQANCPNLTSPFPSFHTLVIVTCVIASIIFILICVCLLTCCLAPCCLCYKCRKQRNQRQIVEANTAAYMAQPPYSPSGYLAQPPGYQAVAGYEGSTLPSTPPPSYWEIISPTYPAPFVPGQEIYPLTPPSQPSAPPLPSDEIAEPPYYPI